MEMLSVNEIYPALMREGTRTEFFNSVHPGNILTVGLDNITEAEIEAHQHLPVYSGIIQDGPLVLVVFTWGENDLQLVSVTPLNARIIQVADKLDMEPLSVNERILVQLHLIETTTNILKGLRIFTLSTGVSQALHRACQYQLDHEFTDLDFSQLFAKHMRKSNAQLAKETVLGLCGT